MTTLLCPSCGFKAEGADDLCAFSKWGGHRCVTIPAFPDHPAWCECDECLGLDEDGELLGWRTW